MADAARDRGVGHAVIVRVLVNDGRNQKGAEELAGDVLRIADADVAAKAFHAGAVRRVGVGTDCDGRGAQNGKGVEGVCHIACRQPGLLSARHRLHIRPIDEALIPVDRRPGWAGGGLRFRLGGRCRRRIRRASPRRNRR